MVVHTDPLKFTPRVRSRAASKLFREESRCLAIKWRVFRWRGCRCWRSRLAPLGTKVWLATCAGFESSMRWCIQISRSPVDLRRCSMMFTTPAEDVFAKLLDWRNESSRVTGLTQTNAFGCAPRRFSYSHLEPPLGMPTHRDWCTTSSLYSGDGGRTAEV